MISHSDRTRTLTVLCFGFLGAMFVQSGCRERERHGMATPGEDKLVSDAITEMSKPSPAPVTPPPPGWLAAGDAGEALTRLTDHIRNAFEGHEELEKLIFPEGWVRRRTVPEKVEHEIVEPAADGAPRQGIVRVTYQKQSSVIHPTREAAAADEDLLPYPSAQTREQMEHSLLRRRWEPVTVTIVYELRDHAGEPRWIRSQWKSEPTSTEGADWLDRLGVP